MNNNKGVNMFNKYAAYPRQPGLILVRDRWYNLVQVFATDNIRAKIEWFEKFNVDLFQYQWYEMHKATRAQRYEIRDAIVASQDEDTMVRMQHYTDTLPQPNPHHAHTARAD
jgi:hypothetical protein